MEKFLKFHFRGDYFCFIIKLFKCQREFIMIKVYEKYENVIVKNIHVLKLSSFNVEKKDRCCNND